MEKVRQLVSRIAPRARFPGQGAFTVAIFCYGKQFLGSEEDGVRVTKELYPQVAKQIKKGLEAAEKAIYRAVDCCWSEGKNEALNQVIGRTLPVKPRPGELIFYCAYYLEKGYPYFERIGAGLG